MIAKTKSNCSKRYLLIHVNLPARIDVKIENGKIEILALLSPRVIGSDRHLIGNIFRPTVPLNELTYLPLRRPDYNSRNILPAGCLSISIIPHTSRAISQMLGNILRRG